MPAGPETGRGAGGVQAQLARFEEELTGAVAAAPARVRDVVWPALASGGKRLRPRVCFLAGSFGQPAEDLLQRVAVVVELVHTASLLHDDVIDRSQTRRGKPTVHRLHGAHVAVAAGAYLVERANEILHHLPGLDDLTLRKVTRTGSDTALALCTGQLSEVMQLGNAGVTRDDYLANIDRKTGALFAASCRLGALVSGGPTEPVEAFGRAFGRLYQLADDLRDVLGTEAELGKSPGSDLVEGTYTLPVILCLEAGGEPAQALRDILESRVGELTSDSLDDVVAILRGSAGIAGTVEMARQVARDASANLEELPRGEARDELGELTQRLVAQVDELARRTPGVSGAG